MCSDPPEIPNGYVVGSGKSHKIGGTVKYFCNLAYTMTGSPTLTCIGSTPTTGATGSSGSWQGDFPVCTFESWIYILIGALGLLTLGILACLAYLCFRYCCRSNRPRRRVGNSKDEEKGEGSDCSRLCCGCCFYCMRAPEDTTDGCCDYYGCCGYAGCCACCCWCCRCCREMIEPNTPFRVRQKKPNKPMFSIKRQKSMKSKNRKKKTAILKLNAHRRIVRSTVLPTTKMVHSLVQKDSVVFRKIARKSPDWMPHSNPVRNINTSTK